MKIHRLLVFAILLSLNGQSVLAADAEKSAPRSKLHADVIQELRASNYVKNISCERFSNMILAEIGLPALGQISPVKGIRGNMDRHGEREDPPQFEDSVSSTSSRRAEPASLEKNAATYNVIGESASNRLLWQLTLSKTVSSETTQTRFWFQLGAANNHSSCELIRIDFQSSDPKLSGQYDVDRCIDLFDAKLPSGIPGQELVHSCALGLRYFLALKSR